MLFSINLVNKIPLYKNIIDVNWDNDQKELKVKGIMIMS